MKTRLFVGNLSWNTTEESLRAAFAADGRAVKSVSLLTDRETGRSRGFGFVEMETPEDAASAIDALNETSLDGRNIRVNEAQERSEGGGGGRGGGGGGGGRGGFGGGGGGGGRGGDRGGRGGGGGDRGGDRRW
jgi:RNA recognition motif-containing protein